MTIIYRRKTVNQNEMKHCTYIYRRKTFMLCILNTNMQVVIKPNSHGSLKNQKLGTKNQQ